MTFLGDEEEEPQVDTSAIDDLPSFPDNMMIVEASQREVEGE